MKYKVTLNGRTYEVEVEAGKAMLVDEYEAYAPAPAAPAAPAAAPAAPAAPAASPAAALAAGEVVKGADARRRFEGSGSAGTGSQSRSGIDHSGGNEDGK